MKRAGVAIIVLAALWGRPFFHVVQGQGVGATSRDEAAMALPTPAKLAIWTDKPGYLRRHDQIRAYLAVDPMGDTRKFHQFIYMESIDTGLRQYLVLDNRALPPPDTIVDVRGRQPRRFLDGEPLAGLPPTKIWHRRVLRPGLWQFVVELRNSDTTEIVKRAHAKFVVSDRIPVVIGADGRDTEISTDTTWSNDEIRSIRHRVFVNSGATLIIEPGTLVLARGPQAYIVVERGGRIVARGRPDAPIVMTCDESLGLRSEGCWGGLVVLGSAPPTPSTSLADGVVPEARALYGGDDPEDSSGALHYVRVEFAGAGSAAFGFYGVGSGTLIDHVQAHASAGDGILFTGGTANCTHCVSSGAIDDGLAWALGWQGTAQHVFLQQGPAAGDCGIEGENDKLGFGTLPRSAPRLYNLTLLGSSSKGRPRRGYGGGILLQAGSALTARNVVVMDFSSAAIDVRDDSPSLFFDGTSSIGNAILHGNAGGRGGEQVNGGVGARVGFADKDPQLVNVRYQANPDPRPRLASPALRIGVGAVPPSDGVLDTSAQYIGAFGDLNWLEEWTFFGPESDYQIDEDDDRDDER